MSREATYQLLQLQEKLKDNLSSAQIAGTLDELLMRALNPLIQNTQFVEYFLADVLPYSVYNSRRKLSNVPIQKFHDMLMSVVVSPRKDEKLATLRKMRMERTIYFMILKTFKVLATQHRAAMIRAMETDDPATRAIQLLDMQNIEKRVGYDSKVSFYSVAQQTLFWYDQATEFRNMVIEKFVRLAHNSAAKAMQDTTMTIDKGDLFRDLILSISRAIDKYDSQRGTLTQYIQWWILDGVTNHRNPHQYGTAYTIPTAQRKKMQEQGGAPVNNLSVSLDQIIDQGDAEGYDPVDRAENLLQQIIDRQDEAQSHMIAIRADPHGIASLAHGLKYTLSAHEILQLRSTHRAKYRKTASL